eukprot:c20039_g1_i1 orf=356-1978(-)
MTLKATELWTYIGSLLGLVAFGQTLINALLPPEIRVVIGRLTCRLMDWFSSYSFIDIPEYDGVTANELYSAIKLHLSKTGSFTAKRVSMCHLSNSSTFTYSPANNEPFPETFDGGKVLWEHQVSQRQNQGYSWKPMPDDKRSYVLKVHKNDRDRIVVPYLEHIMEHAKEIRRLNRERLLYTNSKSLSWDARSQPWEAVPFKHPSTFETLALDPERKARVVADLVAFAKGEQFYQKTGRAWKRGYLLYGPPGTGKSSMIAAMANFLSYDVYDLELTEVHTNAELRKLLIRTTNKSIIVIEDIDCSLNLTNRARKPKRDPNAEPVNVMAEKSDESTSMTLSGLLNFTDGLWSCCGSERIFVFTTNHIDRLDPALLRSGRMDVHIFMSYCTFPAFKILTANYLDIQDHRLFPEIERIIDDAHMTPADVSEILIKHRHNPDAALEDMVAELNAAKEKPWPLPIKEDNTVEDEEEEKRALETEMPDEGDMGNHFIKYENCEGSEKTDDLKKAKRPGDADECYIEKCEKFHKVGNQIDSLKILKRH